MKFPLFSSVSSNRNNRWGSFQSQNMSINGNLPFYYVSCAWKSNLLFDWNYLIFYSFSEAWNQIAIKLQYKNKNKNNIQHKYQPNIIYWDRFELKYTALFFNWHFMCTLFLSFVMHILLIRRQKLLHSQCIYSAPFVALSQNIHWRVFYLLFCPFFPGLPLFTFNIWSKAFVVRVACEKSLAYAHANNVVKFPNNSFPVSALSNSLFDSQFNIENGETEKGWNEISLKERRRREREGERERVRIKGK